MFRQLLIIGMCCILFSSAKSVKKAETGARSETKPAIELRDAIASSDDDATTGVGKAVFRRIAKGIDTEFVGWMLENAAALHCRFNFSF